MAQARHPAALGHTERLQQASDHHLDPTGDGGHRSRGQAASASRTRCHSPRRRRENPTHPSARVRHCRTREALAPGDTLHCRRRGLRGAQLRSDTTPTRQRSHWRQDAKLASTDVRPQESPWCRSPSPVCSPPATRRSRSGPGSIRLCSAQASSANRLHLPRISSWHFLGSATIPP